MSLAAHTENISLFFYGLALVTSAPCNQQVADYTMDTKDKEDSKDICCVRFVCGFSSKILLLMLGCGACKNCCGPKTPLGKE